MSFSDQLPAIGAATASFGGSLLLYLSARGERATAETRRKEDLAAAADVRREERERQREQQRATDAVRTEQLYTNFVVQAQRIGASL